MSSTRRLSLSFLLVVTSALSLWAQQSLATYPFPYSLALFAFSVAAVVLAWALVTGRPVSIIKRIIRITVGAILGFLCLLPIGEFFNRMDWPVFHTWGLAYGSFIFPAAWIGFLVYWILGVLPWLSERAS